MFVGVGGGSGSPNFLNFTIWQAILFKSHVIFSLALDNTALNRPGPKHHLYIWLLCNSKIQIHLEIDVKYQNTIFIMLICIKYEDIHLKEFLTQFYTL